MPNMAPLAYRLPQNFSIDALIGFAVFLSLPSQSDLDV